MLTVVRFCGILKLGTIQPMGSLGFFGRLRRVFSSARPDNKGFAGKAKLHFTGFSTYSTRCGTGNRENSAHWFSIAPCGSSIDQEIPLSYYVSRHLGGTQSTWWGYHAKDHILAEQLWSMTWPIHLAGEPETWDLSYSSASNTGRCGYSVQVVEKFPKKVGLRMQNLRVPPEGNCWVST